MKFTAFTAILVLTVLLFAAPSPALAQGNFSLLVGGTSFVDDGIKFFKYEDFKRKDSDLSNFEPSQSVFSGLKFRFNQDGRVTFGMSYSQWQLDSPALHFTEMADGTTGRELVGTTVTAKSKVNVILATMYVNILTKGKIRPFISVSGGLNQLESQIHYETWVDPMFNPHDFAGPDSSYDPDTGIITTDTTEKMALPALGGGAGINIFPMKHLVVSLSGGYLNGMVFNFGAGVTF